MRQRLSLLTDQAIQVLAGDVFDASAARAIGTGLAQLGYTLPHVLGRTIELLGQDLVSNLADPDAAALQSGDAREVCLPHTHSRQRGCDGVAR